MFHDPVDPVSVGTKHLRRAKIFLFVRVVQSQDEAPSRCDRIPCHAQSLRALRLVKPEIVPYVPKNKVELRRKAGIRPRFQLLHAQRCKVGGRFRKQSSSLLDGIRIVIDTERVQFPSRPFLETAQQEPVRATDVENCPVAVDGVRKKPALMLPFAKIRIGHVATRDQVARIPLGKQLPES